MEGQVKTPNARVASDVASKGVDKSEAMPLWCQCPGSSGTRMWPKRHSAWVRELSRQTAQGSSSSEFHTA